MLKTWLILALLVLIVALPFALRTSPPAGDWRAGDPVLVIISPHNEAIRSEFGRAFEQWYRRKFPDRRPVKVDWRNIGGTSEITRYLNSEYASATREWFRQTVPELPGDKVDRVVTLRERDNPTDPIELKAMAAFRATDDPGAFTVGIDLWFGGGWHDLSTAHARGQLVAPWPRDGEPEAVRRTLEMIPASLAGEPWRNDVVFGTVLSTFGIVYNVDRLRQLGYSEGEHPDEWRDLADPRLFGQVGVTDPTKSGSIAAAFSLMIHEAIRDYLVEQKQLTDRQIADNERAIRTWIAEQTRVSGRAPRRGEVPAELGPYQQWVEEGWARGIRLVMRIAGNARYFTDSAGKVSIDTSMGNAAAGITIDFFGRFQAQLARLPDGREPMKFVVPVGGTSVSCDPIGLLRGAPNRDAARLFIEFVLSEEAQQIWTYSPEHHDQGGPIRYALRRIPIRRDFYPSTNPAIQARHEHHARFSTEPLADPLVDPWQIANTFTFYPRWTADHFGVQRELVRAMALDSGDELRAAWRAANLAKNRDEVLDVMLRLPAVTLVGKDQKESQQPLNWRNAPDIVRNFDSLQYMREWTKAFRANYRTAVDIARY